MENWDLWQKRIIAYSMLEIANRKKSKEVIGKLESSSEVSTIQVVVQCHVAVVEFL